MIIIKSNSFSHGRKKGPAHRRQTKKKKKKKEKKKTKKEMEKQKQKILHLERRVEAIALSQVMLWAYLLVGASATRTVLFASSLDDENERGILRELIPKHFRRVASSRRLLSNSRILFFSPSFFSTILDRLYISISFSLSLSLFLFLSLGATRLIPVSFFVYPAPKDLIYGTILMPKNTAQLASATTTKTTTKKKTKKTTTETPGFQSRGFGTESVVPRTTHRDIAI